MTNKANRISVEVKLRAKDKKNKVSHVGKEKAAKHKREDQVEGKVDRNE